MKIKFKDGTIFEADMPVEKRVTKANGTSGWLFSFSITTPLTSTEVDSLLTAENISRILLCDTDESQSQIVVGYTRIDNVTIRYSSENGSVADVQLSKGI